MANSPLIISRMSSSRASACTVSWRSLHSEFSNVSGLSTVKFHGVSSLYIIFPHDPYQNNHSRSFHWINLPIWRSTGHREFHAGPMVLLTLQLLCQLFRGRRHALLIVDQELGRSGRCSAENVIFGYLWDSGGSDGSSWDSLVHGSLNVPIEHHPTIRYMVYKCL